jgi:hypothetical protein
MPSVPNNGVEGKCGSAVVSGEEMHVSTELGDRSRSGTSVSVLSIGFTHQFMSSRKRNENIQVIKLIKLFKKSDLLIAI